MSDVPDSVLKRIQALLKLAEKNDNEAEASSALAKAQQMLEQHNLSYEAVTGANVGSGAREKVAVEGGFYDYERSLYHSVAELNFCLYWTSRKRNVDRTRNEKGYLLKWLYSHNVVGRKVNVATTKVMASYLLQTASRMTRERCRGWNDSFRFDNWGNSYRRGIVERIRLKLIERRSVVLAEEQERKNRDERAASGASTATAPTLMTYIDQETDANLDFIHGEGYSAAKAAERAETSRINAQQQKGYTRWAAANPEEAARREKNSSRRRGGGGRTMYNDRIDRGAYWSGYDDAASVSIDPQVDAGNSVKRLV